LVLEVLKKAQSLAKPEVCSKRNRIFCVFVFGVAKMVRRLLNIM
jgi:hypothetical protein